MLTLRESSWLSNSYFMIGLDVLGDMRLLSEIPLYAIKSRKFIFGIDYDQQNVIYTGRAYSKLFEEFDKGKFWSLSPLTGFDNIIFNRGAIVDVTIRTSPKILAIVCLKKEHLNKYTSLDPLPAYDLVIKEEPLDMKDLILYIDKDFYTQSNPIYKKLFRKFNKDKFTPEFLENDMEIRITSNIAKKFFIDRKFPNFSTIEERKKFCSILPKFINDTPKLDFVEWQQTETEARGISGKETLSPTLQMLSELKPLKEEMIEQQELVQVDSLAED